MNGSQELAQLADLLRVGLGVARKIAEMRPADRERLLQLIAQAEEMARELDAMSAGPPTSPPPFA